MTGLGGNIQNFELQKTSGLGNAHALPLARGLQQTFNFGGRASSTESRPGVLGGTDDSRRLVLSAGNFSILDFFDKNTFAGDLRQTFFNMAFLTYASYDFVADARGYTWGGMAELYYDDWSLRHRRKRAAARSERAAGSPSSSFDKFGAATRAWRSSMTDKLFGQAGVVRLLGYRNRENMGRFDAAVAAHQADPYEAERRQLRGALTTTWFFAGQRHGP